MDKVNAILNGLINDEELIDEDNLKELEQYELTPYGALHLVLYQYGIDDSKLTSAIGNHLLEDLIKLLIDIGYLPEMEIKDVE